MVRRSSHERTLPGVWNQLLSPIELQLVLSDPSGISSSLSVASWHIVVPPALWKCMNSTGFRGSLCGGAFVSSDGAICALPQLVSELSRLVAACSSAREALSCAAV